MIKSTVHVYKFHFFSVFQPFVAYKCSFKRTNTEKELSDRARTTEMATCDEVAKNEKSTKNIVERNEKGSVDEKTPSLPSPTPASPDQSSPVPQQ